MTVHRIPAPPVDRIPTRRMADCRYCVRYRRSCGRHEGNNTGPKADTGTVPARFGASGTKVHLADAIEVPGRFGRIEWHLTSSVPACGAYTRPGSGWPMPGVDITCTKCQRIAEV